MRHIPQRVFLHVGLIGGRIMRPACSTLLYTPENINATEEKPAKTIKTDFHCFVCKAFGNSWPVGSTWGFSLMMAVPWSWSTTTKAAVKVPGSILLSVPHSVASPTTGYISMSWFPGKGLDCLVQRETSNTLALGKLSSTTWQRLNSGKSAKLCLL